MSDRRDITLHDREVARGQSTIGLYSSLNKARDLRRWASNAKLSDTESIAAVAAGIIRAELRRRRVRYV